MRDVASDDPESPDAWSTLKWSEVPASLRKAVEQHVAAHLPPRLLEKLYALHAAGLPISEDEAFSHFGGGMAVRNLCRDKLGEAELDHEMSTQQTFFPYQWDDLYIGVLTAIAAKRDA